MVNMYVHVYVVWRLIVLESNTHTDISPPLQALFTQFQHSSQSALPPDDLRQALAHCYQEQHRFQLGIMDDAAECFVSVCVCVFGGYVPTVTL